MTIVLVVAATFATTLLSAVAGFGGAVMLLPVFLAVFGPRDAVAVLTITQLVSNGSRAWFNRAEVDRLLVRAFAIGAIPAAVVGALALAAAPVPALTRMIGAFLLVTVIWRRIHPATLRFGNRTFIGIGAASGLGSAILGSVGPLVAPFFLARGLTRSAYIGTKATSALLMHVTKLIVFGAATILTIRTGLIGAALTPRRARRGMGRQEAPDPRPVHGLRGAGRGRPGRCRRSASCHWWIAAAGHGIRTSNAIGSRRCPEPEPSRSALRRIDR